MTNAAPKSWWALLLVVAGNLASTGLVGCGGITEVSSGLAPETLGQDLTAEELDQLCRAVEDYAGRHAWDETAVCRLLGIVSVSQTEDRVEDARLVCQSAYDSCTPRGGAADTFCLNVDPPPASELADCASTVKEIEDCLTLDIARSSEIANALRDCDDIDLEYVAEWYNVLSVDMRAPAGCESVLDKCPFVLGL